MSVLVFIHPKCIEEAKEQGCFDDVLRIENTVLKEQRSTIFDNFPPPYLKKRFARQQRLIAIERKVSEHLVVCFIRLLIRGGREYKTFISDPKGYGDNNFLPLIDEMDLDSWVKEKIKKEPPPEKPLPSKLEKRFLWDVFLEENTLPNDDYIYESEDWINAISKQEIDLRLIQIPSILISILEKNEKNLINTFEDKNARLRIIYRYFPGFKKLFLFSITTLSQPFDEDYYRNFYASFFVEEGDLAEEEIIKKAQRGYPALLLIEEDIWISIQKDKEANLALSPEETSVLDSVFEFKDKEVSGFPLFINGRAGSGKSTILQYLFSDYLRCYLQWGDRSCYPPLYLTYSNELVNRSRTVIKSLLRSNFKKALTKNQYSEDDIDMIIPQSIRAFKEYLLSLVPEEFSVQLFPETSYMDFRSFRNTWLEKYGRNPQARKYGPDLCWHIIRTYIKGLSIDGYLDDLTYIELSKGEKSVSQETYTWVFKNIWEKWYEPACEISDSETRKYWDDQDLVRYILDHGFAKANVPVVFCDEAQDFTRLEQELLLRISIFSNRKLNTMELNRVPFAFAGDPFQTLNPTGFRWESIKTSFVHKFVYSIKPSDRFGITELNYRELSYNYRSLKDIVYLCNSIQLLRASFFDHNDLLPQDTWKNNISQQLPVYFNNSDLNIKEYLKEQTDLLIVVPCSEGEENEYYENDPFLKAAVPIDNEVPLNIVSPSRVKGLEFNRIVLYGFGKYFIENFGESLFSFNDVAQKVRAISDVEKTLPIEYFFNWLYVGASRPKKRLFVIDSEMGIKVFWEFAIQDQYLQEMLQYVRDFSEWEDKIGVLQPGSDRSWGEEKEDTREVAKRYFQDGIDRLDPYFLKQAATLFKTVGDKREYHHCLGKAAEIEKDYFTAGENYMKIDLHDQALDLFWKGYHYSKIAVDFKDINKVKTRLEYRFSNLVSSPDIKVNDIMFLMKDWLHNASLSSKYYDNYWSKAVEILGEKVIKINAQNEIESWKEIFQYLSKLLNLGLICSDDIIIEVAYRAQNFKKIVETGIEKHKYYKPAKIAYLKSIPIDDVTSQDGLLLANHYLENKNYEKSWYLFRTNHNLKGLEEIIMVLNFEPKDENILLKHILELLYVMISNKKYGEAILFTKNGTLNNKVVKNILNINNKYEYLLPSILTEFLAEDPILPTVELGLKIIVSDFLDDLFIKKNVNAWRSFIHPLVVGSAIERAGRYNDVNDYYLRLMTNERAQIVQRDSNLRYIVNKNKLSEFEQGKRPDVAKRYKDEIHNRLNDVDVKLEDIPEFPNIRKYINIHSSDDIMNLIEKWEKQKSMVVVKRSDQFPERKRSKVKRNQIGKITIKYSYEKKRINLEHLDTLETGVIDIETLKVKTDDLKLIELQDSKWSLSEWDLEIDLSKVEAGIITFIRFNEKVILSLK